MLKPHRCSPCIPKIGASFQSIRQNLVNLSYYHAYVRQVKTCPCSLWYFMAVDDPCVTMPRADVGGWCHSPRKADVSKGWWTNDQYNNQGKTLSAPSTTILLYGAR